MAKTNQAIAIVDHYLTDDLPLENGVDAHALSAVLVHDIYGTSERRSRRSSPAAAASSAKREPSTNRPCWSRSTKRWRSSAIAKRCAVGRARPVAATSWPSVDGPDSSASRIFTVLSRTPTPEWISPSSLAVVSSTGSDLVKLLFNGSSRESVIIRAIMPSHIVKWQIGEVSHRVAMKLKGRSWMPKRHVWSGTES